MEPIKYCYNFIRNLDQFFLLFWASSTNSFFSFSSSLRVMPDRIGIILDFAMMGVSYLSYSVTNRWSGIAMNGASELITAY